MILANTFGSDKSLQLAESNTKHINPKTHFTTMAIQQVILSSKLQKINKLSKAGVENKYPDGQMKENQIFVKKIEIFYKNKVKKPSLNIAQVQISDKNLHPSVFSVYYSRGRERERESSTKSESWAC
jgi:hypothetical protein